jgi:hypothetical protein
VCAGPRNREPGTSSKILVHHNIGGEGTGRTEEDRIGRQLRLCNSASQIGTGKKRLHDAYSFTWGIHSGSEPRHTKVQYNNCHDRQTVQASPSPPAECPPPPSTPEVNQPPLLYRLIIHSRQCISTCPSSRRQMACFAPVYILYLDAVSIRPWQDDITPICA